MKSILNEQPKYKLNLSPKEQEEHNWKKYLLANINIDVVTAVWKVQPKLFKDWNNFLEDNQLYHRAGVLARSYAIEHGFDEKEIFKKFSNLIGINTFNGFKRELRFLKWSKKSKYEVVKTSKYADINYKFDFVGKKGEIPVAIQVKSNTIVNKERELYQFITEARKQGYTPVIVVVTRNQLFVSDKKLVNDVIEWNKKNKEQ